MTDEQELPLREQLKEERKNIIEQLDLLRRPSGYGLVPDDQSLIETLEGELREIEALLAKK